MNHIVNAFMENNTYNIYNIYIIGWVSYNTYDIYIYVYICI